MRQKVMVLLTVLMVFASQVWSTHEENEIQRLASILQLSPSQRTSLQIYAEEMNREWVKDHQKATRKLQKILSAEQYRKLMNHIRAMRINHQQMPNTDEEVKAMVERYSVYLLLTANQEAEFDVIALTLCHEGQQLKNQFLKRLNAILTLEQQDKLSQVKIELSAHPI